MYVMNMGVDPGGIGDAPPPYREGGGMAYVITPP